MSTWTAALDDFLEQWKHREEVIGVLVCGSYITGNPSNRSDIDVHIITTDECSWRERGNQYSHGFLIEYFVNPPKQIRSYFIDDYDQRSTMSMVQFLTGKILEDKLGIVSELIKEAANWKEKHYAKCDPSLIELKKYHLWDTMDNLLDCYEAGRSDFNMVYYSALHSLYREYCAILAIEEVPYYQLTRYFSDPSYLTKYLKQPFPDPFFSSLYLRAMEMVNKEDMIRTFKELLDHIFEASGGFNIDGWSLRSKLDLRV